MSYLALYRKYRPTTFDEMVGQKAVITALQNQVKYGQIGHAYLFCGTRGTGKTSTAKVFARAVNCLHPINGNPCNECELCLEAESGFNLVEIDAASNNGVENIRDLREEVQYTPSKGKYKVYIIDEVHMLTQSAFNALLKTLEEPPAHVIFILATTEPHKVLPTILSRCQRYDFKRITTAEITEHLQRVSQLEDIEADADALQYIAALADGGMRDALSILDQCHAYYMGESISLAKVQAVLGAVDTRVFTTMTQALIDRQPAELLSGIELVFSEGRDAMQFVTAWTGYLRNILVSQVLREQSGEMIQADAQQLESIRSQAKIISSEQLTYYIEELAKLANQLRYASQKRIILEVGVLKLLNLGVGPSRQPILDVEKSTPEQKAAAASIRNAAEQTIPSAATETIEAKSSPSGRPKKDSDLAGVLQKWPEIRKNIIMQWQSLYTLNFMKLEQGGQSDELVLRGSKPIYCQQLEMKDGEKLKLIADEIEKATGIRFRLRAASDGSPKAENGDLSDIMNQIHTDVNWRNE